MMELLLTLGWLAAAGLAVAVLHLGRRLRHIRRELSDLRRRADATIEERATYLRALIDHSPLAIVVLDAEARVQTLNPAFEELFLFSREDALGRDLDTLIADEETGFEARAHSRRVLEGKPVKATTQRYRKDGSRVEVEFYGVPLHIDDKLVGIYAIYRDITEQRRLEDELRQGQKMEAVGRLAGGIAHDFNNILTIILGQCSLLGRQLRSDSALEAAVAEIHQAALQAAEMTQNLMTFGRKQELPPEHVDLNDVVNRMSSMLRQLIRADIQLVLHLSPGVGQVTMDPGQLGQVILNLAINGGDAMPEGGTLEIATSLVDLDNTSTDWSLHGSLGPQVQLTVSDTGAGMDEATRERAFEPYFTTKGVSRGTGLGLSTVYGIVQQSGGSIHIDSAPGAGTTFRVFLPRLDAVSAPDGDSIPASRSTDTGGDTGETASTAPGDPGQATDSAEIRESDLEVAPSGSKTILVVEDEPGVRQLAIDFLKLSGYKVLEAADGKEGLDIVERDGENIDLILSDVVMPRMNGPKMIKKICQRRPNFPVLFMSGYDDGVLPSDGHDIQLVAKPFSLSDLLEKVQETLENQGTRNSGNHEDL